MAIAGSSRWILRVMPRAGYLWSLVVAQCDSQYWFWRWCHPRFPRFVSEFWQMLKNISRTCLKLRQDQFFSLAFVCNCDALLFSLLVHCCWIFLKIFCCIVDCSLRSIIPNAFPVPFLSMPCQDLLPDVAVLGVAFLLVTIRGFSSSTRSWNVCWQLLTLRANFFRMFVCYCQLFINACSHFCLECLLVTFWG